MLSACAVLVGVLVGAASAWKAEPHGPISPEEFKELATAFGANSTEPTQLHTSYGEDPTSELRFVWSTQTEVASTVRYGASGQPLSKVATGSSEAFDQPSQFFHRVNISGLPAGSAIDFQVGSAAGGWSNVSTLRTAPVVGSAEADAFVWGVIGDLGVSNSRSNPLLIQDALSGAIDGVLHVGDVAYDLDSDSGARGDAYMNMVAPWASRIPYHACPGNHENADDFKQYRARYWMPGASDSIYHSLELGNAHISLISSEVFFYVGAHSLLMMPEQYEWLEKDLASVDRKTRPWLLVGFHRPMYCSPNDDDDDCHKVNSLVRTGVLGKYALEPLFEKYGVDLVIAAHEHAYARTYPIYNYSFSTAGVSKAADGTIVYKNPGAPIHVINGAAGCPENQDGWKPGEQQPWAALEANVYGYMRLSFPNSSVASWQFVNDTDGSVMETVVVEQANHGPY